MHQPLQTDQKKRKVLGRQKDQAKKARLAGHTVGEDYRCSRLHCFQNTSEAERQALIAAFNALESKDAQDSYLSSLIEVKSVARRRPRLNDENEEPSSKPHDNTYGYSVRVVRDEVSKTVPVCLKGFCSFFGVSHKRVRIIQALVKLTGKLLKISIKIQNKISCLINRMKVREVYTHCFN